MNRNKVNKKIKERVLFAIFAVFISQLVFASPVNAVLGTTSLDWENPNTSGKMAPYKFKLTDVLNSDMLTQVVGCTGIIDKITMALGRFSEKVFDTAKEAAAAAVKAAIVSKVCDGGKDAAKLGTAASDATAGGGNWTEWVEGFIECKNIEKTSKSEKDLATEYDRAQEQAAQNRMEQCFSGIAFTLAKNQLTSLTRYAINWVNTGFGGDPFFVRNQNTLLGNIEREVYDRNLRFLTQTDGAYPYSRSFAKALVAHENLRNSSRNMLFNLNSTLANFITDPNSYEGGTEFEKSRRAVQSFYRDFNTGGWNAWFAFTQNEANNPLGYQMLASDYIEGERSAKTEETKEELSQNNGFLSQKRCVEYQKEIESSGISDPSLQIILNTTNDVVKKTPVCIKWETVTPGSIIKDKLANYLTSPERQLEMADSINEVLNSVFSMMLSKLADQGVLGITAGDRPFEYSSSYMVNDTNVNSPIMGNGIFIDGGDSSFSGGKFNLTRDLGNRYNYNYNKDSRLGTWNVSLNKTTEKNGYSQKLIKDRGPVIRSGDGTAFYPANVYYEVTTAGKFALIESGYNGWEVGDRAFWDGEKWQNWKCGGVNAKGECKVQTHPIAKRGVVQIQKDYKVAARELLQNLPTVMPKLGELDYCIPGPNVSWSKNYEDAIVAFSDFAYSTSSKYKPGSWFLARDASVFEIAKPGDTLYDNYANVFKESPSLWKKVTETQTWKNLQNLGSSGTVKKDKLEEQIKENINKELDAINKKIDAFRSGYTEIIDGIYGRDGLIQAELLYREDEEDPIENPAYLEAARVSYPILSNITQYEEDINNLTQKSKEEIVKADTNLYKLTNIMSEVSKIIKAAQARREEEMMKMLKDKATEKGVPSMTLQEFKNTFATCIANEDITFYDDLEIMKDKTTEAERCNDGLDNDWDNLVDNRDPDCTGSSMTNSGERVIRSGGGTTGGEKDPSYFDEGEWAFDRGSIYEDSSAQ